MEEPPAQKINVSVYNLSNLNLTGGEISLLGLGIKFVPVTEISMDEKKVDILRFSRKLLLKANFFNTNFIDPSLIKPKSCYIPKIVNSQILKNVIEDLEIFANELPEDLAKTNVMDNLTTDQRMALSIFKQRRGLVYFKADKGSSVVILNEDFYKVKILSILDSMKYEKLPRNVDYFIILRLKNLTKKYKNMLTNSEKRAITSFDYKTTNIYGLPKLHKSNKIKNALATVECPYLQLPNPSDLEFRLIFGGPTNPTSGLADLLNILLKPFVSKVHSRVSDVFDFINKIPKFGLEDLPFIEMVSVDVKSMYENLEQNLGLPALRYFLTQYKNLLPTRFSIDFVIEAMIFVLENNTGYFDGNIYRQVTGTATGIKPAPPYADLAMGYLEIKLFYKLRNKLGNKVAIYFWKMYRRYLDDGFVFWDKRLCDFEEVYNILNSMYPSIRFTMERDDWELKYLDIVIYKKIDCIQTAVFNKETDSGTYLPFTSSHPRHCKTNIPFSMARRIKALTDDPHVAIIKLAELANKLKMCGYPEGLVHSAVERAKELTTAELRKCRSKNEDKDLITFVHTYDPCYPGLFGKIKSLISRLYTSRECRSIFGGTRIIDSRREPLSLLRIFQHSRFDDSRRTSVVRGVSKCGFKNCKTCYNIMEVDKVFFNNSGISYKINYRMNCMVRNVIYVIICNGCGQSYIGETTCLRERTNAHRSNSNDENRALMEVSRHLYNCGQSFKICPIFKLKDECKILRLFKENSLIKLLKPDLNTDKRNLLHLQLKS